MARFVRRRRRTRMVRRSFRSASRRRRVRPIRIGYRM